MHLNKLKLEKRISQAEKLLRERNNLDATNFLHEIVEEDPVNESAWLLLGIAKRRLGKIKEAIKCFKAATEIKTSMVEAWGLLTISYIDYGKISKAKEAIEKASELNPNNDKLQFYSNCKYFKFMKDHFFHQRCLTMGSNFVISLNVNPCKAVSV